ncbi:MAG TPA: hypothetical protein VM143_13395 [Acidimicrobiales bacterium]|nr:hypothetical protein [Acidimicrobiales bacterium]
MRSLDVNLTCAALAGEECLDGLAGDQQLPVDVGHPTVAGAIGTTPLRRSEIERGLTHDTKRARRLTPGSPKLRLAFYRFFNRLLMFDHVDVDAAPRFPSEGAVRSSLRSTRFAVNLKRELRAFTDA